MLSTNPMSGDLPTQCSVCEWKGLGGFMGVVEFGEEDDGSCWWTWVLADKRVPKQSTELYRRYSARDFPSTPDHVGGRTRGIRILEAADTPIRPRCVNGHKLASLDEQTMSGLIRTAIEKSLERILIPE